MKREIIAASLLLSMLQNFFKNNYKRFKRYTLINYLRFKISYVFQTIDFEQSLENKYFFYFLQNAFFEIFFEVINVI